MAKLKSLVSTGKKKKKIQINTVTKNFWGKVAKERPYYTGIQ